MLDHVEHNFAKILASMNATIRRGPSGNHWTEALQGVVANAYQQFPARQTLFVHSVLLASPSDALCVLQAASCTK